MACCAEINRRGAESGVWRGDDFEMAALARRQGTSTCPMPIQKGFKYFVEEARRKKAVLVAIRAGNLAEIVAGPQELIAFGDNDPRALIIKAEMPFDR